MYYISATQGDTLGMNCVDDAGDISSVTIESAVSLGGFYQALTVTETDLTQGEYALSADTTAWPIGSLNCDIKYTSGGTTSHTEQFQIVITDGVTK